MIYKYSICHPDKAYIEYPDTLLSADEVKEIALNYPWESELQKLKGMNPNDIQYNPSLDFIYQDDNHSFCLTAEGEPDDFSFSVWFNRPKMKKVLFGLLGEKEVFEVIDKLFSKGDAFRLLDNFLDKEYATIEKAMNKTS